MSIHDAAAIAGTQHLIMVMKILLCNPSVCLMITLLVSNHRRPSFNGALASIEAATEAGGHAMDGATLLQVPQQYYCVINTLFSLLGSVLSTFALSSFLNNGRIDMMHVQNATLAGERNGVQCTAVVLILHYMRHSTRSGKPRSGANERLIEGHRGASSLFLFFWLCRASSTCRRQSQRLGTNSLQGFLPKRGDQS
jgi:hypothetical protein